MRYVFVCCALMLAMCPVGTKAGEQVVVESKGDVRIADHTVWRNRHSKIHGNLIIDKGGVLEIDNSTIELMCGYSREFKLIWNGGKLISRNSTIGGTMQEGIVRTTNLELTDGEWDCKDTTVRYIYGIAFDHQRVGKLRAENLMSGPWPDSVIMTGKGDVVLKNSEYAISLTTYAGSPGQCVLDMPVGKPISRVFDSSNVPGAQYRLEMVNCRVPTWFLFVQNVSNDGPLLSITLRDCPRLIPSILGGNLRGKLNLPQTIVKPFTFGNVSWSTEGAPVSVIAWGVYCWGDKTDLTLTGPTRVCELFVQDGKVNLVGEEGTYNAITPATTIDVGREGSGSGAQLAIRNATIGTFRAGVRGQITAKGSSSVTIERAKCSDLTLLTLDKGAISISGIKKEGEFEIMQRGGPIKVE